MLYILHLKLREDIFLHFAFIGIKMNLLELKRKIVVTLLLCKNNK
jgi:hypothetical protein